MLKNSNVIMEKRSGKKDKDKTKQLNKALDSVISVSPMSSYSDNQSTSGAIKAGLKGIASLRGTLQNKKNNAS